MAQLVAVWIAIVLGSVLVTGVFFWLLSVYVDPVLLWLWCGGCSLCPEWIRAGVVVAALVSWWLVVGSCVGLTALCYLVDCVRVACRVLNYYFMKYYFKSGYLTACISMC